MLVSAAAGGVGQIAVQIARIEGCRVVGIAGGAEKCAFVARELGAHAVIDYKAEQDLSAAIARACPDGVDLYFDNVGGPTLDAALAHLREGARVVLCGRISQTVASEPYGIRNLNRLAAAHGRMQGFLVFNYHDRYDEARTWLAARLRDGSLRQRLHVLEGLDAAPIGLGMLFRGENTASSSCAWRRSHENRSFSCVSAWAALQTPAAAQSPGSVFKDCPECPEMVVHARPAAS